ncbi:recombinase family protein [Hansschlegelia plantiphila]|uniref:Resolvase n=1 Tax=Hansschlegelia plantiphila TaxID=374655 RepID=A0A9W6J162_9HYPH|nr:recombinase family protein [Hansschlegelia plantiphila]GLK68910.1 resolvase [Hansschlegelia plantiphila]
MQRVIAYTRVSTQSQADSGFGLRAQKEAIDAFAKASGYKIVRRFEDAGISAMGEDSDQKRPELRGAIELSKTKGYPILVSDLSRLARDTDVLVKISRYTGHPIIDVSLGENADPVVVEAQARRAQFEGEEIGRLTKEALARKKAEGVVLGNPKIAEAQKIGAAATARKADGRAEELVPLVEEARLQDITAVSKIADFLNARGHRPARGDKWTAAALRRPLARASEIIAARDKERRSQEEAIALEANLKNPNWGMW